MHGAQADGTGLGLHERKRHIIAHGCYRWMVWIKSKPDGLRWVLCIKDGNHEGLGPELVEHSWNRKQTPWINPGALTLPLLAP